MNYVLSLSILAACSQPTLNEARKADGIVCGPNVATFVSTLTAAFTRSEAVFVGDRLRLRIGNFTYLATYERDAACVTDMTGDVIDVQVPQFLGNYSSVDSALTVTTSAGVGRFESGQVNVEGYDHDAAVVCGSVDLVVNGQHIVGTFVAPVSCRT